MTARRAVAVMCAVTACAFEVGAPVPAEAATRDCGKASRSDVGALIGIRATNVSCRSARRLAIQAVCHSVPQGWRLSHTGRVVSTRDGQSGEQLLRKGRQRIRFGAVGGSPC